MVRARSGQSEIGVHAGQLTLQDFLDRYQKEYGRRPEMCVPVVNRDLGRE